MKSRLQFSPAAGAAILIATLWFALWLTAFQPAPVEPVLPAERLAVRYHLPGDGPIQTLHTPTLFALPSEQGFSGQFPEARVHTIETQEQTQQASIYLPRAAVATAPEPDRKLELAPLPQAKLSMPGEPLPFNLPQPGRIAVFLSPQLQARTGTPIELDVPGELPPAVRATLRIRPDGSVAQCFLEPAIETPELMKAIRKLRFQPADSPTDGWLDIRFTPGSSV